MEEYDSGDGEIKKSSVSAKELDDGKSFSITIGEEEKEGFKEVEYKSISDWRAAMEE
jgi:hypothetical protein